jgi:hypothetical protein
LLGDLETTFGTRFRISYYGKILPHPEVLTGIITGPTTPEPGNPNVGTEGTYTIPATNNGTSPATPKLASSGKNQRELRHTFRSSDPDGAGPALFTAGWDYATPLGSPVDGENRVAFETDWTLIEFEVNTEWTDAEATAAGFRQTPGNGSSTTTVAWADMWDDIVHNEFMTGSRFTPGTGPPGEYYNFFGIDDVTVETIEDTEENADFDGDGDIDGADFLTWQRGVSVGTTLGEGDADGDEDVDAADLAIWESQFGGAQANAGQVPEPGALALLAFGGLALAWRRRATRSS